MTETLEDKFEKAVKEWSDYCFRNAHHSNPAKYLDCEAYRSIIAMGPQVLPLIKKRMEIGFDRMSSNWLVAIANIIPDELCLEGRFSDRYTANKALIKWLDENMHKYLPTTQNQEN